MARPSGYRPRFGRRRRRAAIAAINMALAGDFDASNWPPGITREDLEGAKEAIEAMSDKWTSGKDES